jgi:hypothetical protein
VTYCVPSVSISRNLPQPRHRSGSCGHSMRLSTKVTCRSKVRSPCFPASPFPWYATAHRSSSRCLSDALQRAVAAERSRASASAHKVEELRQLLKEKAAAMETLHRQLLQNTDGGARRSARPVSSAASGAFIRGGAGSNSDRKAVEFLRKSGRYSGTLLLPWYFGNCVADFEPPPCRRGPRRPKEDGGSRSLRVGLGAAAASQPAVPPRAPRIRGTHGAGRDGTTASLPDALRCPSAASAAPDAAAAVQRGAGAG